MFLFLQSCFSSHYIPCRGWVVMSRSRWKEIFKIPSQFVRCRERDISVFFWNILYALSVNARRLEHRCQKTNPSFRKPPAEVDGRPAGSTALCKHMPVVDLQSLALQGCAENWTTGSGTNAFYFRRDIFKQKFWLVHGFHIFCRRG